LGASRGRLCGSSAFLFIDAIPLGYAYAISSFSSVQFMSLFSLRGCQYRLP